MNVLDENIPESQRQLLKSWGMVMARSGMRGGTLLSGRRRRGAARGRWRGDMVREERGDVKGGGVVGFPA